MKHLYIVKSAGLGKIFCNFCYNPMVLLILFDPFLKCLLNVNLLSKVNPKCFCNAWETSLLKRKGGWQTFFSFLEKNCSLSLLVKIRVKTHLPLKSPLFYSDKITIIIITVSWITEVKRSKRSIISKKLSIRG